MKSGDRRFEAVPDRRLMPRGGRRPYDMPGRYPPVLLADAYEAARVPCAAYLDLFKFEVAEVAAPKEAIALLDAGWMPQIILADAESAASLSERFASRAWPSLPPLILLAGFLEPVPWPTRGILLKPFRLRRMLIAVRRALRTRAAPQSIPREFVHPLI